MYLYFYIYSWIQMYGASKPMRNPCIPWQCYEGHSVPGGSEEWAEGEQAPVWQAEPITGALGNLGPRTQLKSSPLTLFPTPKHHACWAKMLEKHRGASSCGHNCDGRWHSYSQLHTHILHGMLSHSQSSFCADQGLMVVDHFTRGSSPPVSDADVAGRGVSLRATIICDKPRDSRDLWWYSAPNSPSVLGWHLRGHRWLSMACIHTACFPPSLDSQVPAAYGAFLPFQYHLLH